MLYVVMEIGWEYDDSYYSRLGGGNPVVVYKDRSIAEMECLERNIEYFKTHIISANPYGGSLNEYFGYDGDFEDFDATGKLVECLNKYNISCDKENWQTYLKFNKELTDDQIEEVLSHLNLRWFEIVDVPDTISAKVYKRINKK